MSCTDPFRGPNANLVEIVGGWAYPVSSLAPLAERLEPTAVVSLHPFTTKPVASNSILAGWSLGGLKALQWVLAGDATPRALVLISGTARFCGSDGYPHGAEQRMLKSMLAGIRRDRGRTLNAFYDLAGTEANASEFSDAELLTGLRELDQIDERPGLPGISPPVLLLHGRADRIIPCSASEYLREHLPNARLDVHEKAGHDLPLRHPEWVAERIAAFIGGLSSHF